MQLLGSFICRRPKTKKNQPTNKQIKTPEGNSKKEVCRVKEKKQKIQKYRRKRYVGQSLQKPGSRVTSGGIQKYVMRDKIKETGTKNRTVVGY